MPKNRKFVKGGSNLNVRTKFKVGGRKSARGAKQMSDEEINKIMGSVRKRDRNKLLRALDSRMSLPS